ncbi:MAG TPA: periplasmic heavy metal sensor [Albidovulum sp.]|uniref:periplasmic heavy metal sensor n=1 Tax=Albidovulum sp. TaxID=1872424 RepID=UPI002C1951D7|nr:periplasmic heavy metal sensor [Albidovulum sp.]
MDEPTKTETGVAAPKAGRGMKIALILSLTLNLMILGVMGGAMLAHGGRDDPRRVRDVGFGPYTEALSPEDRKALREAFVKAAPDFRAGREEARADVAALAAAIRAEPYDRAAVEAVMANQVARIEERLQLGRGLLLDRLDAMGPEARAALAGRIETMRMMRHD